MNVLSAYQRLDENISIHAINAIIKGAKTEMYQSTIRKQLIIRLLLAWIFLSVLIGAAVYFMEVRKIEDFVLNLATQEARGFTGENIKYLNSPEDAGLQILRERSREHIHQGHFIMVNLYDRTKKIIVEVYQPNIEQIRKKINEHKIDLFMKDAVHFKKFYDEKGQMYLMVLIPLESAGREVEGYLEGVYKVDVATMREIKSRLTFSLFQVVLIVFFTTAAIYPIITRLNRGLIKLTIDLSKANIGVLKVLGNAIAKRDHGTSEHNYRVTIYAVRLAEAIGLGKTDMRELIKGAFLHDVGKIAISDNILLKPGKLTEDEFRIMKTHVHHGVDIIANYGWLKYAVDVVRFHHEKFDGSGYIGARGDEIPLNARIFAIADVFDALTSRRPYKEPYTYEYALQVINDGRAKHFDPRLVDEFSKIADSLYAEIIAADEPVLEEVLSKFISRYFSDSE